MTPRRTVLLVCAVLGLAVAVTVGTTGAEQTTAERDAEVTVASADRAHLGLDTRVVRVDPNETEHNRSTTRVVLRLENRFGAGTPLEVNVRTDGRVQRTRLGPGDATTVSFRGARCGQPLHVTATTPGETLLVETTREPPCSGGLARGR